MIKIKVIWDKINNKKVVKIKWLLKGEIHIISLFVIFLVKNLSLCHICDTLCKTQT